MILRLITSAAIALLSQPSLASTARPHACFTPVSTSLAQASFANNGAGVRFSPARLKQFEHVVGRSFEAAAQRTASPKTCAKLRSIKVLRVETASGADELIIFTGERPDTIVLQWSFAEAELAVPSAADLDAAIRNWSASR